MKITDEHIAKLQNLYLQNFGIEINKEQALEQGIKLITLFTTISATLNNHYQQLYDNKSNSQ